MKRVLHITAFLFFLSTAEAAHLDLAWSPNEEPDLAGYRVYYGTSPREYIGFVDTGKVTTCRLDNLLDHVTYFISVTAYDRAGNESGFSEEVSGIGSPDEDSAGPAGGGAGGGGCFVSILLKGP